MAKAKSEPNHPVLGECVVDTFASEEIVELFTMGGIRVARMPFRFDEMCIVMEQTNVKFVEIRPAAVSDPRRGIIDMRPKDEIPADFTTLEL